MNQRSLSQSFKRFTEECKGSSELYEFLSSQIADDERLLELAAHVREGQPGPNMLFGAVHHLLLQESDHDLKYYYPSMSESPENRKNSFASFKDFCLENQLEIIGILRNKSVQTNEVRRCAYLYPTFNYAYKQVGKPLAMIEIGTSAGLQLMWDQYSYSYGTDQLFGNVASKVHLTSEVRGELQNIQSEPPIITQKIGVDLNVVDLEKHEDVSWLKALIWPEHKERLALFDKAIEIFKGNSPKLIEGNGVDLLEEISREIPEKNALCIFHTHVANQFSKEMKFDLLEKIEKLGHKRDIIHVYNNIWDEALHLDYWIDSESTKLTLGDTEGHGRWFEWNLSELPDNQ